MTHASLRIARRSSGRLTALILFGAASSTTFAGPQSTPTPEQLLQDAGQRFQAALSAHDAAPGSGQAEFLAAADLYGAIINDHAIDNHVLHANRGAALLLAGDTGHAVAAFRRAERLDPTDPAVVQGLAAARAKVGATVAPAMPSRLTDALLAWRGHVPRPVLAAVAIWAYVLAWIAGAARLLGVRRATTGIVAGAVLALACAAPLVIERALDAGPDHAVIVAREVVGLNGPSVGAYGPTFASPLQAGLECRIMERRGDWVRIRLADARDTWVPRQAIEEL